MDRQDTTEVGRMIIDNIIFATGIVAGILGTAALVVFG